MLSNRSETHEVHYIFSSYIKRWNETVKNSFNNVKLNFEQCKDKSIKPQTVKNPNNFGFLPKINY